MGRALLLMLLALMIGAEGSSYRPARGSSSLRPVGARPPEATMPLGTGRSL